MCELICIESKRVFLYVCRVNIGAAIYRVCVYTCREFHARADKLALCKCKKQGERERKNKQEFVQEVAGMRDNHGQLALIEMTYT